MPELTKVDDDSVVVSGVAIDIVSEFVIDVNMEDIAVGVVVNAMDVLIIGGLLNNSELVDWDIESVEERVVVLSILLAAVRN